MNLKSTSIGIELGSTRIKAVLIDENYIPVASGSFEWENRLINGIWTYTAEDITTGIKACFADLKKNVKDKLGLTLTTTGAIGISAMMHGYLPFDASWNQLAEFRTWRNTMTGEASAKLTELFNFNIPQRWCISHLYQSMLNKEAHLPQLAHLTTLAGYISYRLSGENIIGIGEASGMFPIDSSVLDFDGQMLDKFEALVKADGYSWSIREILPKVLTAGESAGVLTKEGALFIDPDGDLEPGIPVAPCEGDAGTGMVATNSVRVHTGNVSAGTSDFAMIVTDHKLGVHKEIDMVTTPDGLPVAMVHCNNCTSDINAWASLFNEVIDAAYAHMKNADGSKSSASHIEKSDLFNLLFEKALEGEPDCGGIISYNYFSGESVTGFDSGRPVLVRKENCSFNLANFMRCNLLSALATLKVGMDILTTEENIRIDRIYGHGGFFKTPGVGQRMLSAAVSSPVSVMTTAGEGGAYGMAVLAAYMKDKKDDETLPEFLENRIFADAASTELSADEKDIEGFNRFLSEYKKGLAIERAAVENI